MPPYLLTSILFGSAVLCAVLTSYTWRRRTVAGTRHLILVLVGSILSMIGYGLELITPDLPGKLLFVQIRYLGTALATPAFVLSALWYAGRERWLTPRYVALIALLPVLSESPFLFNDWHHLHYVTVGLDAASGFPQLIKTNGPLYWLYTIHSLVYVILAAGNTAHAADGLALATPPGRSGVRHDQHSVGRHLDLSGRAAALRLFQLHAAGFFDYGLDVGSGDLSL